MKSFIYSTLAMSIGINAETMTAGLSPNLIVKSLTAKKLLQSGEDPELVRSTQSVSYGCWCFFEEMPIMTGKNKPFKPKGKPVDKLDGYCKQLTEAYECVAEDYQFDRNGDICDVRNTPKLLSEKWWVDLNYNLFTEISDTDLKQSCLNLNNGIDSCEVYVCMIEASFLIKFWDKSENFLNDEDYKKYGTAWDTYGENIDYEGNFYDYENLHTFNPEEGCIVGNGGTEEKSCCGEYPNRAIFRPKGGMVGCCNGQTYNSMMHSCCDNSGNEVIGDIGC